MLINNIQEQEPFSIVYQILQGCPFKCGICNRRFERGEKRMSFGERELMIRILKGYGLRRLTVTGGEPMVLGKELFNFLRYVHQRQIHTCISTTGYNLVEKNLEEMNKFLDHLLISIRSLNLNDWVEDFGRTKQSEILFKTVLNILHWIKSTDIILEVSTVVHRKNIEKVIELGWKLAEVNPGIIWRIEDYYAMGIEFDSREQFEITNSESDRLRNQLNDTFKNIFKHVYFSNHNRVNAPDFFITPKGELVTTLNNRYSEPYGHILDKNFEPEFKMRRDWSEYKKYCRDWVWSD